MPPRKPQAPRLPVSQRAGTVIDHEHAEQVYGWVAGKRVLAGYLDHANKVFQSGGEANNFVLWSRRAVTLSYEAWLKVQASGDCETIEMIDHDKGVCWRTSYDQAWVSGYPYDDAKLGRRWGVPLPLWTQEEPPHGDQTTHPE